MAFQRYRGETHIEWFPKLPSTTYTTGQLLSTSGVSGVVYSASATTLNNVGICRRTVAATDTDYATAGALIPVEVGSVDTEYLVDGSGFSGALIGKKGDIYAGGLLANGGASSVNVIEYTGVISATQAIVKLVKAETNNTANA